MKRRTFLKIGAGGLALPFLEGDGWASDEIPPYLFVCRQANGVTQADGAEPDRFWPTQTGDITQSSLAADSERVLSELAPWAEHLLICKGLKYAFPSNINAHLASGNQCLTAAKVWEEYPDANSLAMGESIDNYVARHFPEHGGEPLTLYTGPRNGQLEEVLSYRGSKALRAAEDDPWQAYQRMLGFQPGALDHRVLERRESMNDLVLEQIHGLMNDARFSSADRQLLELHFDSVRDFERLAVRLSEDEAQQMALHQGQGILDDNRMLFARMHMDLLALVFSCGYARAATLQIGDGDDATEYTIDGERFPSFHWVSHRIYSDGEEGESIQGAVEMHHKIDRLFAQTFGYHLSRLQEYGILDRGVSVFCNDLGSGVSHSYYNVPFILAGSANGFFKTGQFVDFEGIHHNKLLNTLISSTGLRNDQGGLIDDFGDPSLEKGVLESLLA